MAPIARKASGLGLRLPHRADACAEEDGRSARMEAVLAPELGARPCRRAKRNASCPLILRHREDLNEARLSARVTVIHALACFIFRNLETDPV